MQLVVGSFCPWSLRSVAELVLMMHQSTSAAVASALQQSWRPCFFEFRAARILLTFGVYILKVLRRQEGLILNHVLAFRQVIKNGEMLGVAPMRNKNTVTMSGTLALMGQQNLKVRIQPRVFVAPSAVWQNPFQSCAPPIDKASCIPLGMNSLELSTRQLTCSCMW
jgi:hypothetical protein